MQIVDALKHARQRLIASDNTDSDSVRLDTEILLCSVLKCERTHLYSYPEQILSNDESESFNALVDKRSQGHPIAHLTKQKEFWSLSFHVTKDTLIPRPETELLVEIALERIPINSTKHILDLGTGSGAIAIAIASERSLAMVTATDASDKALNIAKHNADLNNIDNINFIESNWFVGLNSNAYDLIISNPPYISNDDKHLKQGDVRFEPLSALASGKDGLDDLRTIIHQSTNHLEKQAWLLVEHGYNQGAQVRQLFTENNFTSVTTIKDYSDNDRVSIGYLI
ncbi:MAG TPA: peptide chain release factor N(5)-glutamine methyltransferase [Thiotrichaceae bacterium]|jgi:release factor glutamine methyltransferase|nr:peptide chain release factor N(5)-glutamine methyltransferase [Thiotrichaceae bacterium]HIM09052.1 peptide chain release factor N(5)-glutamine methyltransferase [Gammaproteobacteria bacterium]